MMSAPGPQGDEPHKSPTVVVEDMGGTSGTSLTTVYRLSAKRYVSLSCAGSMGVERAAKPFKNSVYTKLRAGMNPETASILLRCGLNLNFVRAAGLLHKLHEK